MSLRQLFIRLIMALGQFFVWLAVILRWLAKRLEKTAETDSTPTPEPAPAAIPEPAQQQPPDHWLAHVRREPPADWLEKVRQGAPQLLDPQLRPSRPPAPPPPASVRPAGHRPPSAAERGRARQLQQLQFRPAAPAANQPGKQSPPVAPAAIAVPPAQTAPTGPPGSTPESAEAVDDGPPLPEGRPFSQAAFDQPEPILTEPEPTTAKGASQLDESGRRAVEAVEAIIPDTITAAPPAQPEILPLIEKAPAASQLRPTRQRTLFSADFPRQTLANNDAPIVQSEAAEAPPAQQPAFSSRPTAAVPSQPVRLDRPTPPTRPTALTPAPSRQEAPLFEEKETRQQPVKAVQPEPEKQRMLNRDGDQPGQLMGKGKPPAADPFTPPTSTFSPFAPPDNHDPAVVVDYWPPLIETAASQRPAPGSKSAASAHSNDIPGRQQQPTPAARNFVAKNDGPPTAQRSAADLWPSLPNSPLDDDFAWEVDLHTEQQERRLRLEFEQRGPEWNE